ncbi:MAG: hypothetical protein KGJ11_06655, partial [Candidatus Omnitrophica bacterium]|nr:hypothetical protein [Candidatus Omnitrophota bacterium]
MMMRPFKRLFTAIFLTVLSVILLFSAGFGFLIVTPWGGEILIHYFKQQFAAVGLMHVGHYQGNLYSGFVLTDMRIRGLSYLPDAFLRVQQVRVHLFWWDLVHPDVDIFNARLFMPESDPVVFTGQIHEGNIKGDLYAR